MAYTIEQLEGVRQRHPPPTNFDEEARGTRVLLLQLDASDSEEESPRRVHHGFIPNVPDNPMTRFCRWGSRAVATIFEWGDWWARGMLENPRRLILPAAAGIATRVSLWDHEMSLSTAIAIFGVVFGVSAIELDHEQAQIDLDRMFRGGANVLDN